MTEETAKQLAAAMDRLAAAIEHFNAPAGGCASGNAAPHYWYHHNGREQYSGASGSAGGGSIWTNGR